MATPLRIVLIGLGRMGKNHFRVIRQNPNFSLEAVVDRDAPPPDPRELGSAKFLRSLDELKAVPFDCAVVATPTASHFQVAKALIEMGKHVLVEKPLCSTFSDGSELLRLAQAKGARLAVGHVERFNPAVRKLREVIREGWLGKAIHFSFTRVGGYPETLLQGNNVLLDLAVHDIDVLRGIVGPLKLESSVSHSTVKEGVYDTAEMLFSSASGATATVHVNWITPTKIRTIRVTGTRGVCFVDYILQTCELAGGLLLREQPDNADFNALLEMYKSSGRIQFGVQKEEPLKVQLTEFHRFVTEGVPGDLCIGSDAVGAVLLAERAIQLEASRGKPPSEDAGEISADSVWI